ncbi:MAG: chromate transporter, partial [Clostridia bacterium]|nr:chromate transporter [Clostridia bacterium]
IGVAALKMVKTAFRLPPCILVTILAAALYLFLNVNCVYLILMGAVLGLVISEIYERCGKKEGK